MEIKLLLGVNLEALPISIREEFEKIKLEFKGNKNDVLRIDRVFYEIRKLQFHGKLYENNSSNEEEEVFSLLSKTRFTELQKEYDKGFLKGYERNPQQNNLFRNEDDSIMIQKVFSGIYNTFDTISPRISVERTDRHPLLIHFDEYDYLATGTPFKSDNKTFLCIDLHFYEYGERVGEFVKCWDIILNNYVLFEEIFNKNFECLMVDESQKVAPEITGPIEKPNPLLINGIKPNISERYKIANEVLNLEEIIRNKNILASEKHILLAQILGCNQQVARDLFNGAQQKRTKVREDLINEYLKTLN